MRKRLAKTGIIYKASCVITNKVYIGLTTKKLNKRREVHWNGAFIKDKNEKFIFQAKFARAIRKYPNESDWKWEILYENVPCALLCYMEKWIICIHDSYNNGYNSTLGGDGGVGHHKTRETIEKLSRSIKIAMQNPELRKKLSDGKKGDKNPMFNIGQKHPMFGKKHTEAAREKMSKVHLGQVPPNKQIRFEKPCSGCGKIMMLLERELKYRKNCSQKCMGKAKRGLPLSDSHKKSLSDSGKRAWNNDEKRTKILDGRKHK